MNKRLRNYFRKSTAHLRKLPSFIIIGGMKCGSTALFEYLMQHPDILPPDRKEIHFFDNPRYLRGLAWYRKHFPLGLNRKKITGEASPYYIFHPLAANRIKESLPEIKVIAVLRNPVDRAYSHFQHTTRKGFEELTFEKALREEEKRLGGEYDKIKNNPAYSSHTFPAYSYRSRGIYHEQLEEYYRLFDKAQILVLQSENLFSDPQQAVDKVTSFLRIDPCKLVDQRPKNKASYEKKITELHYELAEFYQPHNEQLYKLIGENFDWGGKYAR